MTRNGTSAGLVAVALLAALCVAPGALAQNAGTPVATPVTGSMTVVTVDQLGNALAGACYNLVSNGVLLADVTCSGQQGVVVFGNLPADGSYDALPEARAPRGCAGQDVQGVTLTPQDPNQTTTVTNDCGESSGVANNGGANAQPPWTGTLTVHTIDQNGAPLAGACYSLGTAQRFMAMQEGDPDCSGPDGAVVISGFWAKDGSVRLTQTMARPGCQVNANIPPLTFSQANATQEITVTNQCQTAANITNPEPAPDPSSTTRPSSVAAWIGKELPPTATHTLDASTAQSNAQRG